MSTTVKIGAEDHAIQSFSGYKAVRAGAIVARITEKVPSILNEMAEFQRDYEDKNELRLTPDMAKLPKFSVAKPNGDLVPLFGEEDFKAAKADGRDYISIPQAPTTMEKWAAVFPTVFKAAEHELRELFGLILIEPAELERADEAEEVDEVLAAKGREILHKASLSEMLELLVVTGEVLRGEFEGKEERLRPILEMVGMAPGRPSQTEPEPSSSGPEPSDEDEPELEPETSPPSSEPSPTDLPEPTGGPEPTPSTVSGGSSSSSSESG